MLPKEPAKQVKNKTLAAWQLPGCVFNPPRQLRELVSSLRRQWFATPLHPHSGCA
jgi:hypothetical protein